MTDAAVIERPAAQPASTAGGSNTGNRSPGPASPAREPDSERGPRFSAPPESKPASAAPEKPAPTTKSTETPAPSTAENADAGTADKARSTPAEEAGKTAAAETPADKLRKFYLGEEAKAEAKPEGEAAGKTAPDKAAVEIETTARTATLKKLEGLPREDLVAALEPFGFDATDVDTLIDTNKAFGRQAFEVGEARKQVARAGEIEKYVEGITQFTPEGKIAQFDASAYWDRIVAAIGPAKAMKGLYAKGKVIVDRQRLEQLIGQAEGRAPANGNGAGLREKVLREVARKHAQTLAEALDGSGVAFDADKLPAGDLQALVAANPEALFDYNESFGIAQGQQRLEQQRQQQAQAQREQQIMSTLKQQEEDWRRQIPNFDTELAPAISKRHLSLYDRPLFNQAGQRDPQAEILPEKMMELCRDAEMLPGLRKMIPSLIEDRAKVLLEQYKRQEGLSVNGELSKAELAHINAAVEARKGRPERDPTAEVGPRFA